MNFIQKPETGGLNQIVIYLLLNIWDVKLSCIEL